MAQSYEEILSRALVQIPNTLDKRQGSSMYLAIAPLCIELAKVYEENERIRNESFADTATSENLTRRCAERGVNRKQATYAIRRGVFNKDVAVGSRFGIEGVAYKVIENLADSEAKLECEQLGEIGNVNIGDMLPITYINGLKTAQLTEILIPGEEIEDDESLRKRYFDSMNSEAFGGNIADYKKKVKELQGIGGVKVYPAWNGGGTVKLVIIDSSYNRPSQILIDSVQTAIDPMINGGVGLGIAPIGHVVTVEGVEEVQVILQSLIILMSGVTWEDVENDITDAINQYFLKLRKNWEDEYTTIIRISQIESNILRVIGVLDIQNTLLNNQSSNLILNGNQIPVLEVINH